ncbi:protein serine/threonine phosphatase 2C [Aspergillus sclerotioniger CBS 115572]|uniref:Protein serine/threonine phosphatase 2C n=1 Tax=Aspergillus sclerotioniger CBS 115572 TaxID=1450535 RepID=A0A317WWT9_9EURO|nr:protein serine/threonine phosphatase 2C [Aspergillus sclerotioniger CBS 115572]PWY89657.1 protein serine/threonine phosphatase 2C [Aspergillus sclerotioniger CBS 115572]
MLPFRVARTRLCVTPQSLLPRTYFSTKRRPSSSTLKKVAVGCAITVPALWYLIHARMVLDDAPYLQDPPTDHWDVEPSPYKDQVTSILSQGSYVAPVQNVPGVVRYDGAQVASNNPCEDYFIHGKFPSPWNDGNQWMAWGLFDGHGGGHTAELLKEKLLPFVRHSLNQVERSPDGRMVPEELIQHAIMKGFQNLDNSIIETALSTSQSERLLQEKVKRLTPAFSGSCALLSLYDPSAKTLHVACTGDSRAVLGSLGTDGKWEATPLSVDQTGFNEEEAARIHDEHPGENVVVQGRVLGFGTSRAFGDSQLKWPLDFQQEVYQRFYGPSWNGAIQTPPYVTAKPVVTSTKIDPESPSFLIMATDGLWDMLSSQQAVDLVGKWLEPDAPENRTDPEPTYEPFDFGPLWKGMEWKFVDGRTTAQDDNVAVHLVRNSLGGNHHEMLAGRLALSPPFSRHARDDVTVQVVFFHRNGHRNKYQSSD